MTEHKNEKPYRIARHAGNQGARFPMINQVGSVKYTTGSTKKLMRCKNTVLVSTFNVRTLNGQSKKGELTYLAEKYTSIQEHKLFHPNDSIKHHEMGKGWMLITSSAEKSSTNVTIRGVGILLSPHAYGTLLKIETVSARIMVATFNGNPKTTVISCYSPTNCSDESEYYLSCWRYECKGGKTKCNRQ